MGCVLWSHKARLGGSSRATYHFTVSRRHVPENKQKLKRVTRLRKRVKVIEKSNLYALDGTRLETVIKR